MERCFSPDFPHCPRSASQSKIGTTIGAKVRTTSPNKSQGKSRGMSPGRRDARFRSDQMRRLGNRCRSCFESRPLPKAGGGFPRKTFRRAKARSATRRNSSDRAQHPNVPTRTHRDVPRNNHATGFPGGSRRPTQSPCALPPGYSRNRLSVGNRFQELFQRFDLRR